MKGYLFDRLMTVRAGLRSAGNVHRGSFRRCPLPCRTNRFIEPGRDDPEGIVGGIEHGLFVTRRGRGRVDVAGRKLVVRPAKALLIRNGRGEKPVRGTILIGNAPGVMMEIDRNRSRHRSLLGGCSGHTRRPAASGSSLMIAGWEKT